MTNQLCSYSRGSEFRLIALGARLHILSFQLYLFLAVSVFEENYCASIFFLVNGDNWRMLWGPEEYISGCHIYYHHHPIPLSHSGLESGIPCPSFTRRMCRLTVCVWTTGQFYCSPSQLLSLGLSDEHQLPWDQSVPGSDKAKLSVWTCNEMAKIEPCVEPFGNWPHFNTWKRCWVLGVPLLPVSVMRRQ